MPPCPAPRQCLHDREPLQRTALCSPAPVEDGARVADFLTRLPDFPAPEEDGSPPEAPVRFDASRGNRGNHGQ